MKLTEKILKILADSATLQGKIADLTDKSFATVKRWIENNDDELTKAGVLQIIREATGLKDKDILIEEAETVKK